MCINIESENRFNILDPMRLLAAFGVVFYHFLPLMQGSIAGDILSPFKYGYLGVSFFFMLSGFVIMKSCQNRGAFEFAFARAIRIYPAFISCLAFTLLVVYFCGGQTHSWLQILSNALIINDYIGQPNIDGVYWTLQAELKFYACIFLLSLSGALKHWRVWLSSWLILAITHYFFKQPFFLGWFISPAYSFLFIGGVSAFLLSRSPSGRLIQIIFLVALVFACIQTISQCRGFISAATELDEVVSVIMVATFFLFFYLLANRRIQVSARKYWPLMGALSYPLYLLHNRAGKSIEEYSLHFVNSTWAVAISIMATLTCALFVVLYVEKLVFHFLKKV
jgi:peptidoglycan/LPS O-acetylase OafA/YrhL